MDAQTWLIIAIVGFSLSVIALIIAIIMFFKLKIPAVIGDLSGKTVAREIRAMRDANASSGKKIHRPSPVNANRGKLTEKVKDNIADSSVRAAAHASKRLDVTNSGQSAKFKSEKTSEQISDKIPSGKTMENFSPTPKEIDIEHQGATDVLSQAKETDLLIDEKATDVLSDNSATELLSNTCETEILSNAKQTEVLPNEVAEIEEILGTTVLSETQETTPKSISPVAFNITRSIVKIHTEEEI